MNNFVIGSCSGCAAGSKAVGGKKKVALLSTYNFIKVFSMTVAKAAHALQVRKCKGE